MPYTLKNPCQYSFNDLLIVSKTNITLQQLYSLSQYDRNTQVKKMCKIAGWYYNDVIGTNNITYTAFSPELSESSDTTSRFNNGIYSSTFNSGVDESTVNNGVDSS